jgi:hypothetical protein
VQSPALQKIEKWLEERGIREHCRTVCKGKCCLGICGEKRCKRPPLPCAIYLCDELLDTLFGFHNKRNYRANYLAVTSIVFGNDEWDMCDMGKIADNLKVNIPDNLIEGLMALKYESDIHD